MWFLPEHRIISDRLEAGTRGGFVAEIMPTDTTLPVPKETDSVTVTGVWVYDSIHGHNELHPLRSLAIASGKSGTTTVGDCPSLP